MRSAALKFLLVIIFVLGVAGQARAQQEFVDTTKIPELPDYVMDLPQSVFMENTREVEEHPLGDKALAFKVRLPKGWRKEEDPLSYKKKEMEEANLSQRILGEVAKYYGPTRIEEVSRFEVWAQQLEYEITAKNWFIQEILARGYSLEGLRVYSDRRVEALYVVVEGDTAYAVRAAAEINGSRMVIASYYVPDSHWEEERAYQQRAIQSFHFISPEKSKIEMTESYKFLDLLQFDYPASWKLIAPNIYSIEGMEAKVVHSTDQRTLGGEIALSIVSSEFENALAEEIDFIKKDLEEVGLEVGDLVETRNENYKFGKHVLYSQVEVYNAVDTEGRFLDHEFWLAVIEEARYYYVVIMLTPSRTSEFYVWARNSEAFQTIIESIRP